MQPIIAALFSLVVNIFQTEPSSKLVMMRRINAKKENLFEDAVFNRNLSEREISGLQYLVGLCHP